MNTVRNFLLFIFLATVTNTSFAGQEDDGEQAEPECDYISGVETFDKSDNTGFSSMIRELIFSEYLKIYHIERYRHRLSIEGEPLYYFAIAGRKNAGVPSEFLDSIGISA